ncbi:MAG TPA: C69 family dipeptidase [Caulobacteraceae bacterium]
MCDTMIALKSATARGAALFAKNSDRERNEAQVVEMIAAGRHEPGANVQLTYIAIPQAPQTYACLICRPYWMWGAEMGVNAHGVAIGNEAVHATLPAGRRRALTGMDLVRLGLERSVSAAEAVEILVGLLERHGQGGDGGHLGRFYYDNSFLIADPREAYIVETVGRWWAVRQVHGVEAISNALTIGDEYDRISPELAAHAKDQGWSDADGRFDFTGRLIDTARDAVSFGSGRCARSRSLMEAKRGAMTVPDMIAILRDHGPPAAGDREWRPDDDASRTICMHAASGARRSQTTGSMVSELSGERAVHWVTASSAPCLSVFKPVLFESGLPDQGPAPGGQFDVQSRWWRHERLHRAVLRDFAGHASSVRAACETLERAFSERIDLALAQGAEPKVLRSIVADCWREADDAERVLSAVMKTQRPMARSSYRLSWARLDQVAGMPGGKGGEHGRHA